MTEENLSDRAGESALKRAFRREESPSVFQIRERRVTCVLGMAEGAGSTFIATSLAYGLRGKEPGFLDIPDGDTYAYDSLGMDRRLAGRTLHDVPALACGMKSIKRVRNMDEKINWAQTVPGSAAAPSFADRRS